MRARSKGFDITQIIQRFLPQVEIFLSGQQRSVLKLITQCKTVQLGGHKEKCSHCRHKRIHYNSCGNRHCPNCQATNKLKWVHDRNHDLLPVKYFHAVFTVPSELYDYFRYNKETLYDLLFRCVRETILEFGQDPKHGIGGKIGAICVLHTWTQQMTYHPHVHCIIPAGGFNAKGKWVMSKSKGDFLFPVKAMSRLFRGKLLAAIHDQFKAKQLIMTTSMRKQYYKVKNKLYRKEWVAYNKKAFGGPQQVLSYLGNYTHKICISNYRIMDVDDQYVTFKYQDRKNKITRTKKILGTDFIHLFAQHILPKGFVKIRHIGFLASRCKRKALSQARQHLNVSDPPQKVKMDNQSFILMTTGKDISKCPVCRIGEMVITDIFLPIRGSPKQKLRRRFSKNRKVVCS